jgi:dTDP-4-dehydrorhamnose reductase
MKVVVLGGTGLLGKELQKVDSKLICFGRNLDIRDFSKLYETLMQIRPDLIINAAAEINSLDIGENPYHAINTNIIGAANVAKYCLDVKIRLAYISTDYIYSWEKGNSREIDLVHPFNEYAWTKLGGECSSRLVEDSCIIRTNFGAEKFPYEKAYSNLWTSKDYVDILAPRILKAAKSSIQGIINIGTERKTMLEFARKRNPDVNDAQFPYERDFSLNTEFYDRIFNN